MFSSFLGVALLWPSPVITTSRRKTSPGTTRPADLNLTEGRPIPQPWAKQTKWQKTRYIEYTDATFKVRKPQPEWLGIMGPIIRGEVGDEIVVDFLNRSRSSHGIHPHGVRYDKDNEGAYYVPAGRGSLVPPNGALHLSLVRRRRQRTGAGPAQLRGLVVPPAFGRARWKSTPGSWGRSSSPPKARRNPTAVPRMWTGNSSHHS